MAMEQDYWKRLAGPRWAADQARMDTILAPYAASLEPALRVPPGATLVDVGCGCGATTVLAQRLSAGATIVGLDVSEPMLEVAKRRALPSTGEPQPAAPVSFLCGDAATEPIAPGSVHRIVSRFGVMFFRDPVAAFTHMRGWLAPEGRMVFVVWGPPANNPWLFGAVHAIAPHVDVPTADPEAPGPMSLSAGERRRAVFHAAGLLIEEELDITSPVRVPGSVDDAVDFFQGRGPVGAALAAADEDARAAALAALRSHVTALHDGTGIAQPAHAIRLTLLASSVGPRSPQ